MYFFATQILVLAYFDVGMEMITALVEPKPLTFRDVMSRFITGDFFK